MHKATASPMVALAFLWCMMVVEVGTYRSRLLLVNSRHVTIEEGAQ